MSRILYTTIDEIFKVYTEIINGQRFYIVEVNGKEIFRATYYHYVIRKIKERGDSK